VGHLRIILTVSAGSVAGSIHWKILALWELRVEELAHVAGMIGKGVGGEGEDIDCWLLGSGAEDGARWRWRYCRMPSLAGIVDVVGAAVGEEMLWGIEVYAALCLVTCFAQMV
jgi:hypothetical protein